MKRASAGFVVLLGFAACAWVGLAPASPAQPAEQAAGHSHAKCELHGGRVSMTEQHHFETVLTREGIQVYLYSADQQPMPVGKATGTVTLKFKDGSARDLTLAAEKPKEGEKAAYYCPMHPAEVQMEPAKCKVCGMNLVPQYRLSGNIDLSKVAPGPFEAVIQVKGMEGAEPQASFTESYAAPRGALKGPRKPTRPRAPEPPKTGSSASGYGH